MGCAQTWIWNSLRRWGSTVLPPPPAPTCPARAGLARDPGSTLMMQGARLLVHPWDGLCYRGGTGARASARIRRPWSALPPLCRRAPSRARRALRARGKGDPERGAALLRAHPRGVPATHDQPSWHTRTANWPGAGPLGREGSVPSVEGTQQYVTPALVALRRISCHRARCADLPRPRRRATSPESDA